MLFHTQKAGHHLAILCSFRAKNVQTNNSSNSMNLRGNASE